MEAYWLDSALSWMNSLYSCLKLVSHLSLLSCNAGYVVSEQSQERDCIPNFRSKPPLSFLLFHPVISPLIRFYEWRKATKRKLLLPMLVRRHPRQGTSTILKAIRLTRRYLFFTPRYIVTCTEYTILQEIELIQCRVDAVPDFERFTSLEVL